MSERAAGRDDLIAVATVLAWTCAAVASGRWGLWFGVGSFALVAGVMVLVVDPLRVRGLLRPALSPVVVGLAAGLTMCCVTYAAYPLAARAVPAMARATGDLYLAFRALPAAQAALALGPVIAGEELAWRGLVQGALARRFGSGAAVVVGALAYALAHAPAGSPLLVIVALCCGLFWGALRAASGSLWAPLVAHVTWDIAVLLVWPLAG